MSYSEENGQVVLRMSREDYRKLNHCLDVARLLQRSVSNSPFSVEDLSDRLNAGNPNYTSYPTGEPAKK